MRERNPQMTRGFGFETRRAVADFVLDYPILSHQNAAFQKNPHIRSGRDRRSAV
jgi:hypothetical protein